MANASTLRGRTLPKVVRSLELTWIAGYAYFALEWLFFVTKPSLLNFLTVPEQLAVLFVSPLPWLLAASGALLGLCLPGYLALRQHPTTRAWADVSLAFVPGLTIACTQFLLLDNFTYVIFEFGVISLTGVGRVLHTAVFAALVFAAVRFALRQQTDEGFLPSHPRVVRSALAVALVTSLALAAWARNPVPARNALDAVASGFAGAKNVLIFSSDGVDAKSMSAYSAVRDTTPFIRSLLPESLVFENHFTNSAKTTGSVASLLSGKLPTTTRMVFRPDVFRGIHVYQHMPGLLRAHGYHNGDFSVRHYADARDLNMREGFHYANGRDLENVRAELPAFFVEAYPSTALFIEETWERIQTRLLHVFGLHTMENPFAEASRPGDSKGSDRQRVDELKAFIRRARRPFFAHVHLMASHGTMFPVERQVFSKGRTQTDEWDRDFYDDAILQYDRYVREVVALLRSEGLLDETLLVLNTDHGFRWSVNTPLPLIMRFPGGEHAGISRVNSQRVDIAPTVLDYLGIPRPRWLEGRSLLSDARSPLDPIYVANRMPSVGESGQRVVPSPKPPFYTLGSIGVIHANAFYMLDLRYDTFRYGLIADHTRPVSPEALPRPHAVHAELIEHLNRAGYDTTSLKHPNRPRKSRRGKRAVPR